VTASWYTDACGNLHPEQGLTQPNPDKPGAYSFCKAPRYANQPYETVPGRMWIAGLYDRGISAMDRIVARALEASGWPTRWTPGSTSSSRRADVRSR